MLQCELLMKRLAWIRDLRTEDEGKNTVCVFYSQTCLICKTGLPPAQPDVELLVTQK